MKDLKHIRRFNESSNVDEVLDWMKECFLEFSDEEKYDVEFEKDDHEYVVYVFTGGFNLCKDLDSSHGKTIEDFIEYHKSLFNFHSELDTSIKRILDKFENMKYEIDLEYMNHDEDYKEYVIIYFYDEKTN